ncbi:hypothetical protein niasHT_023844 [Heterodera trifolii]|uniref:Delta(3,5)-Delta(2,4)-dienoyl-CoA isomerase, mitochondrial n=1 Tax=Heterodera trifolii TaxID=157864 RepID=A0ABD2JCM1_9BILA
MFFCKSFRCVSSLVRCSRYFCASSSAPVLHEISIVQPKNSPGLYNVQLNRAKQRNTFTLAFWRELETAFDYLADESNCRAIVLSANGPSFCAGIDLQQGVKELLSIIGEDQLDTARKARAVRKLIQSVQSSFTSLERCPKPVIAAIHSHCIGAGISLVSCADIRYASIDSTFSIREVDIGLAADVGILQRIHLISGNDSWARELAFTGRDSSAHEAQRFGFVSRIFDSHSECVEAALELGRFICGKSPVAVQGSKLAMNYARTHTVNDALDWVANWNAAQLQTEDIGVNLQTRQKKKENPKATFNDVP